MGYHASTSGSCIGLPIAPTHMSPDALSQIPQPGDIYDERELLRSSDKKRVDEVPLFKMMGCELQLNEAEIVAKLQGNPVTQNLASRFCESVKARGVAAGAVQGKSSTQALPVIEPIGCPMEHEDSGDLEVSNITSERSRVLSPSASANRPTSNPRQIEQRADCLKRVATPMLSTRNFSSPPKRRRVTEPAKDTPEDSSARYCRRVRLVHIPAGVMGGDVLQLFHHERRQVLDKKIEIPLSAYNGQCTEYEEPPQGVSFIMADGNGHIVGGSVANQHSVRLQAHRKLCKNLGCRVVGCKKEMKLFERANDDRASAEYWHMYVRSQRKSITSARLSLTSVASEHR